MALLAEDNGNFSTARLLSIIIVLAGIAVGLIPAIQGNLTAETVTLSLGLVTIGYGGKVVSKGLEK